MQHVKIHQANQTMNIINIYCPRGITDEEVLDNIPLQPGESVIIAGDFNASHVNWGYTTNTSGSRVLDWINNNQLALLNYKTATHIGPEGSMSAIDLTVCTSDILPNLIWSTHTDLFGSDHFPIYITNRQSRTKQKITVKILNWDTFARNIGNSCININSADDLNETYQRAVTESTSTVEVPPKRAPWWNMKCSFLRAKARRHLNRARRQMSTEDWDRYKFFKTKLKELINRRKKKYWQEMCEKAVKEKNIYKILSNLKKTPHEADSYNILNIQGRNITEPKEQATALNTHFAEQSFLPNLPLDFSEDVECDLNKDLSWEEFDRALDQTRNSTPGPDGITKDMIQKAPPNIQRVIFELLSKSFDTGEIPKIWTHSILIPILKPHKNPRDTTSFRPIALTSIVVKILERIILNRLMHELYYTKNTFNAGNHGFLPKRSCITLLTELYHNIWSARARKNYCILAAVDIKSAYDSIWRDGLISTLQKKGVNGKIATWIHNFVTNRTTQVRWRNRMSDTISTTKGIPQGSILSPFLFLSFLDPLHKHIPNDVKCLIYADDIYLFCEKSKMEDAVISMNHALKIITNWCNTRYLTISAEKCSIINMSNKRARPPCNISINNKLIKEVKELRVLGITLDRGLTWKRHFDLMRSKASRALNVFRFIANRRWGGNTQDLLTIGNATIRSLFEYGAPVISSAANSHYNKIEPILNSMLRTASGLPKFTPLEILRTETQSSTMKERHLLLKNCFFIKQISLGQWSPISNMLWNPVSRIFNDRLNKKPPITSSTENFLEEICIQKNDIIPWCPYRQTANYKIHTTDLPFQKKSNPDKMIQQLCHEFMGDHPKHIHIGTDGSKTENGGSIGIVIPRQHINQGFTTNPHNSIFTIEALAIYKATKDFIECHKKYIIFSDSLSVLTALECVNKNSSTIILQLHRILCAKGKDTDIILVWCPGHKGVLINELADKAARSAELYNIVQGTSAEDLIQQQKTILLHNLERNWNQYYKKSNFPHINPKKCWNKNLRLKRHMETFIQNFRANTLFTNAIKFKIKLSDSPNCLRCNVEETIDHIMFNCPTYTNQRQDLLKELTKLNVQPTVHAILSNFSVELCRPVFLFFQNSLRSF